MLGRIILFALLVSLLPANRLDAYPLLYAEQLYNCYHQELHNYPVDLLEGLTYLIAARSAPFANPLYALARIETETEWELYRYLFLMHVNLLLAKGYLQLGDGFDQYDAYFFREPFQRMNLDSMEIAEEQYNTALEYWQECRRWAEEASQSSYRWLYLEEIAAWHDEQFMIVNSELDYEAIIHRHLSRLQQVRRDFEAMDGYSY